LDDTEEGGRALNRHRWTGLAGLIAAITVGLTGVAEAPGSVLVQDGDRVEVISLALYSYRDEGTVAYQGPVLKEGEENWKPVQTYGGVPLEAVLQAIGGLDDDETLGVIATDGWYKILPAAVVHETTPAGTPILALSRRGDAPGEWEDAPMLVFLPEDRRFSNDDMVTAFSPELSHYYAGHPSTTGFMVKNVGYLIVNYDGGALPKLAAESTAEEILPLSEGILLSIDRGGALVEYTLADLEQLEVITAQGTFTNSAGVDYTATYTGVPLTTLIGNLSEGATVRVTASDGYSMNYPVEMIVDRHEGTWILAFKENGDYMPLDPGYLRIVLIGKNNPHFESSLSARMVERIEILGVYEEYTLLLKGAVERLFTRGELEAGIGCPCHTATVTSTRKGEAQTYTGLPLWRLIAYVDDGIYPDVELGIHYNDEDFNDDLAAQNYTITLTASDGYAQTVASTLIAGDDRFIVAFKKDGVFLDPAADGYMRFTIDDSVEFPEGMTLKPVKFLVEINIDL